MIRRLARAGLVAATATMLVMATGTSASAGTDATSSTKGSWSRFISYGDKFENCDTAQDWLTSYVAYQYVRKDGSLQTGEHYNPGGHGDCWTWDHDFGEGRTVWFRSCVDQPFGFEDTCDRWRTAIA